MARMKSPKYPNFPLAKAISHVQKILDADGTVPLPREVIAKHLGYSGLSGASDATIATIVQFGLLERTGKAEMRLSQLAMDILVPENENQRQNAINRAALNPTLFTDIWNHFDKRVPSPEALRAYLLRRDFNSRAIDPVMRSFEPTIAMLKQQSATESGGVDDAESEESSLPPDEDDVPLGVSASVGDYVQWESQGVLQFRQPKRVRWVSDDGDWVAVDGSNTGIPMSEISIEKPPHDARPPTPPAVEDVQQVGFTEWFRAKVGADKLITINYKGKDDIGPREIEKMIAILEAQKAALEE
ncbi:hypothetical protein A7A08_01065 [Methyloligella halotolerans]|uniref:Uncharacterized protein n=1 Tax=Methyloligella halotolerans TaxID=1177755 RepID=A0A1E2S0N8_9HYPH|nr:hypothetical protein [Methyloligella halotolerans]ODA67898.1 hypothetical protein A7A08_01065 [Methyloligella halotolerans]